MMERFDDTDQGVMVVTKQPNEPKPLDIASNPYHTNLVIGYNFLLCKK